MSTKAYPAFYAMVKRIANSGLFKSAVISGIIGDKAHEERGGYHIGRQFQPSTNYSVIRKLDRTGNGPNDAASAFDITMSKADMIKFSRNVEEVFKVRTDPRRQYVNAFNVYFGSGDAVRLDFDANTRSYASPDHKWHVHGEVHRAFPENLKALDAVESICKGESLDSYRRRTGQVITTPVIERTTKPALTNSQILTILKNLPELKRGDKGAFVSRFQRLVTIFGHSLVVDGDFGPASEKVCKALQKSMKRQETGKVDPTVWCSLLFATTNGKIATFPICRRGDDNAYVKRVQVLCGVWGKSLIADGKFGQGTEDAIKYIQGQLKDPVTGVANVEVLVPMMIARETI